MKILFRILFFLSLIVSVHAQNPGQPQRPVVGPPQPAVPVPGAPAVARPQPQHNPDAVAVLAGKRVEGLNWDDEDVANAYTTYTGNRVLLSSATANMEIRFVQRGPLTNRQAARLLVKILDMEGYVFVPSGANEVKLLPKAQGATGANGPSELEGIIDHPDDIPEGDNYISYFMKLSFIKPEEAVRTFTQSIHTLGPGAKIAPVPNASAVLVTGKASFIRKLLNQQKYIDVAAGNVGTAWVQLKYADAEELATTLNEIVNAQQQRKTTAGVTTSANNNATNRPPAPNAPSRAQAASAGSAGEDIPVQIVANPRLNKLFIMGRPVDIVFVEGLAREFDAPPNRNNFIKRKLRFMIASDFLQVAADALDAAAGPSSSQQGNNRAGGRQNTPNRNQTSNRNQNQGGQNGGRASVDSVEAFNVNEVPESLVVGKTFIVADNIANSILVQGPPESLRIVSELIDKLDGRPQQVMISTVFGQITLGKGSDVGVSVGGAGTGSRDDIAGSSNAGGLLQDLADLGTIAGLNTAAGTASGLNIYGRVKDISATIRALESKTNFKVLSRPTVYTANNRVAVISSGRRIAVPTNTFTSGANVGASQSTNIEFRDVLLRFEVVPLINSEHEVTLRISLLNEDTQGSQLIDGNEIPTIVTESISTTVTIPNKSTVVLGGLVTETARNTKSGVPILSSIPALGRLFSRTTKDVDRRELLIFIQPRIVTGEKTQEEAQQDMERRYDASKPTRDFADGVLPGKPKSKSSKEEPSVKTTSQRPALRYPTRR